MPVARHLLRRYTIILQLFLLFRKIFVKLGEYVVVWVQSITLLCIAELFVCSRVYFYKFIYCQNIYEFKISINYFVLYITVSLFLIKISESSLEKATICGFFKWPNLDKKHRVYPLFLYSSTSIYVLTTYSSLFDINNRLDSIHYISFSITV